MVKPKEGRLDMDAIIRKAVESDAGRVGRTHYKAWMETYTGLLPEKFLAGRSVGRSTATFRKSRCGSLVVAEADGEIVGFCGWGGFQGSAEDGGMGEIQGIYLLNAYKRNHLGRRMLAFAEEQLKEEGYRKVGLWVLDANEGAIRFYEKMGYGHGGVTQELNLGKPVTELLYTKNIG